jgi:hypothetical protein
MDTAAAKAAATPSTHQEWQILFQLRTSIGSSPRSARALQTSAPQTVAHAVKLTSRVLKRNRLDGSLLHFHSDWHLRDDATKTVVV